MPNNIDKRLTKLEAKFEERWTAHDCRAKEMRDDMKSSFGTVFDKLDHVAERVGALPCDGHHQRIKANNKVIWGVVITGLLMILGTAARIIVAHIFAIRIP